MTGETIEKLVIQIQADIDKAQRDLDEARRSIRQMGDEADRTGQRMNVSGKKIGAALAAVKYHAVAAAAALSAVGFKTIQTAGTAEEIENKFNAVFKSTAEESRRWAETFSNTVGRSTIETLKNLSTFQDTFVPLGFDREEAAQLSEQLTQLSADLASFNDKADAETIEALQSALVGNHETMKRYGVILTQTRLDQELLNMGIENGVQGATEQQKVMARLNIIMGSTKDAQGDAARTADEYTNQMKALKGNIRDVMAEAGKEGMEDLTQTLVEFNEWGTSGGYDRMTEGIEDIASATAKVASAAAEAAKFVTDFYTAAKVWDKGLELPEGMTIQDQMYPSSGTMNIEPTLDLLSLSESEIEKIKKQLAEVEQTHKEITEEMEKQTQELAKQNNSIPDWAGHSDYIREQLAATGNRNIGELMGNTSVESFDTVVTNTRTMEQNAGGAISTSLADINRTGFNTVSQKLDKLNTDVVNAVNNIKITAATGSHRGGATDSDIRAALREKPILDNIDIKPRIG